MNGRCPACLSMKSAGHEKKGQDTKSNSKTRQKDEKKTEQRPRHGLGWIRCYTPSYRNLDQQWRRGAAGVLEPREAKVCEPWKLHSLWVLVGHRKLSRLRELEPVARGARQAGQGELAGFRSSVRSFWRIGWILAEPALGASQFLTLEVPVAIMFILKPLSSCRLAPCQPHNSDQAAAKLLPQMASVPSLASPPLASQEIYKWVKLYHATLSRKQSPSSRPLHTAQARASN